MSANAESNPKRPRVTKRERQTAADLPLRPLKKLEKDEIPNFLTDKVKFFVVLVISDSSSRLALSILNRPIIYRPD